MEHRVGRERGSRRIGPIPPIRICPLCGGTFEWSHSFTARGVEYVRCRTCQAYVSMSLPSPDAFETYYRESYYSVYGEPASSVTRLSMFSRLLDLIPRRPPGRLLDVGCGAGDFLALARQIGWDVIGVEPSVQACSAARKLHGLEVLNCPFERADLPGDAFDVVTLLNVIDQAPEPIHLLESARRVLRPGGLLVLRILNGAFHRRILSWIQRLPERMRQSLQPLVVFHPYCLNQISIRKLLAQAQMEHIRVLNAPISGWATPEKAGLLKVIAPGIQRLSHVLANMSAGRLLISPSLLALSERESV
jgi:SAM-dependent methyltransferase